MLNSGLMAGACWVSICQHFLSFCMPFCLSLYALSICLPANPSILLFKSLFPSVYLPVSLCVCLSATVKMGMFFTVKMGMFFTVKMGMFFTVKMGMFFTVKMGMFFPGPGGAGRPAGMQLHPAHGGVRPDRGGRNRLEGAARVPALRQRRRLQSRHGEVRTAIYPRGLDPSH